MSQKEIDEWNRFWQAIQTPQLRYKHPEIPHDLILELQKLEFEDFLNSAFIEEMLENLAYFEALESEGTLQAPPKERSSVADTEWWKSRQPTETKSSILRTIFNSTWSIL